MISASLKQFPRIITRPAASRFASSKVVGIDLGTTNSAAAYVRDPNDISSVSIIENDEGKRTTPSVVAFDKEGKVIVGEAAKRQSLVNPENTFYATKRLIGRSFRDDEVQRDLKTMPFRIVENKTSGQAYLETSFGAVKSPSEMGSAILSYLKTTAENYLQESINKAVITVPAYFNDSQRQATKDAGTMAGLKVLRVVNEPTAAALSFGLNREDYSGVIAVYDLGGGTFDISILDIEGGVFEVRATNGDTHLGGEDFDNVVVDHIIDDFLTKNPEIPKAKFVGSREAMQRIREAAEKAKIDLSHVKETSIDIPFIYDNKHVALKLQEDELDNMTLPLIERTIPPVKKALKDAEIEPEDIDEVIMVGGMSRMPKIRSIVADIFGKKPNTTVNPDETVALGAAIQGGILSGEIKNVLLLDVTPLTLGIETYGGVFSPLIPRNTTVPVKKTEVFSTGVDGQNGVEIRVYQGERGLVKDNKLIGDFKLTGIPPMPKGVPQIQVKFDIDADGIINVSAVETSSGKENSITVIANSGLTEDEIQRMVDEANANKDRDNLIRQRVELITKADIMISDTENTFERFNDVIKSNALYPETVERLKEVRTMVNQFKENSSDLNLDVNVIKKATDQVQNMALNLFKSASKAQAKSK
ncbi:LAFE_0E07030g1_1 [Lachancea fermentati]|uniref:Iron-sulfur cluster biogenesis chaperone, mitochondrial n=1 Tax=Lachancea fermentati TaxID=4955 RepID=A0A1G4MD78_LACFM|nr:LAFE_0E07030g1_1 [Lachancea fermentati]